MQFQIVEAHVALSAGTPVTVIASTGRVRNRHRVAAFGPRAGPNGQTVVFSHKEPEIFLSRPVRVEPFDAQNVLVTRWHSAGEKIVVQNASLLNQVR